MARPDRILYLHPHASTFVRKDIEFLREHFEVTDREFKARGKVRVALMMIKEFFFCLGNLRRTKAILVMFGGFHSLAPALVGKIFGKKVYIILAGTDCVAWPSINYGTLRKGLQKRVACLSYRLAHRLVPVHGSLMERHDTYYRGEGDPEGQGVYFHCQGLEKKTPFTVVPFGYNPEKWDVSGNVKNPRSFITVAGINSPTQIILKGIGLIAQVAARFPDCSFTVVGFNDGTEKLLDPQPNLHCISYAQPEQLRSMFGESRFYLQVSISEGFPNALCESMLSECIPVGSRVAGIPDIIGETGLVLESYDPDALERLLHQALELPAQNELGKAARDRVATLFHEDLRKSAYLGMLRE